MSAIEKRKAAALAWLRANRGYWTRNEIADQTGVPRWGLTGDGQGALLLLEAEGVVARIGAKRGTKWCAV